MPAKKSSKKDTATTEETIYDRIQTAIKFSKKWHKKVDHNNQVWNGSMRPGNVSIADKATPNYTFAIIKSKLARLYYKNPRIDVQPVNGKDLSVPDIQANAKNAELVVNKQMKDNLIRRAIKKTLLDWKRTSVGTFYRGWKTVFHPTEKVDVPKINPDGTPVMEDILGTDEMGMPTVVGQQPVMTKEPRLLYDGPDLRRIHPKHVHFFPGFTEEDMGRIVVEFQRPYKEVMADTRYNKKALADLEGKAKDYIDKEYRDFGDGNKVKETEDMARITEYHYYDKEHWCVYAKGCKEPLYEDVNPYTEIYGEEDALPIMFIFGDDDLEDPFGIS